MLERLIEEVRRGKVIRIFPNDESAWRLIGPNLAERHEQWSRKRKYLKMETFKEWNADTLDSELNPLLNKQSESDGELLHNFSDLID